MINTALEPHYGYETLEAARAIAAEGAKILNTPTIDTESLNDVVAAEFHAWLDETDRNAEHAMEALLDLESYAADTLPTWRMAAFTALQGILAKATGRE